MKLLYKIALVALVASVWTACKQKPTSVTTVTDSTTTTSTTTINRMAKASREDKNGWIYLHLAGSPADIGFQHGSLAAKEIDTLIKIMQYYLPSSSGKDWAFYRAASARFLWKKIDKEYQDEIKGIAEGLQAKGFKYDSLDVTALNAYYELPGYYVPAFANNIIGPVIMGNHNFMVFCKAAGCNKSAAIAGCPVIAAARFNFVH